MTFISALPVSTLMPESDASGGEEETNLIGLRAPQRNASYALGLLAPLCVLGLGALLLPRSFRSLGKQSLSASMDIYSESGAGQEFVDDEAAPGMSKSNEPAEGVPCSLMEQDSEFVGETKVIWRNMLRPSECCAKCRHMPECRAWALDTTSNECKLKWLPPNATIAKVRRSGVISGLPFRWDRPHSILCVALFRPGSYEQGLLKWQYENRANIFACDEWAVYSSKNVVVAKDLQANAIDSDLQCKMGGEFGTALNTEIFFKLWDRIFKDARYFYHEWIVKTDPDSVFFVDRLRYSVANHHDEPGGVYMNNCKFGLHGPIEVFSKNAVEKWRIGRQWCVDSFSKKCGGMCLWGEDLFIDQCLWKIIKVKRVNDWNLISEAHCDSWDWPECRNGRIVFHPFKDLEKYKKCWLNGQSRPLPFSNGSMFQALA